MAKGERSETDKNRERRLKRMHQRRKREFEEEKQKKRAEKDPKFRERFERKTARETLRTSTNTKVLKTVSDFTRLMIFHRVHGKNIVVNLVVEIHTFGFK